MHFLTARPCLHRERLRSSSERACREPVEEDATSPPSSTKTWEEDVTGVKKRVGRVGLLAYPDERLENLLNFYKIEVASKGPTRHLAMVNAIMLEIKGRTNTRVKKKAVKKVVPKKKPQEPPREPPREPLVSRKVKSPAPHRPAQSSPTPRRGRPACPAQSNAAPRSPRTALPRPAPSCPENGSNRRQVVLRRKQRYDDDSTDVSGGSAVSDDDATEDDGACKAKAPRRNAPRAGKEIVSITRNDNAKGSPPLNTDRPLPPGWQFSLDCDGNKYYFNTITGGNQYDFPDDSSPPPPPPRSPSRRGAPPPPQSSGTSRPESSTGPQPLPSSTCAADFSGDQRREQIIRFRAIAHHSADPERRALIMGELAILEMRESNKKRPR